MPPEYIDCRLISKKFDMFSFGVIIIKMVAGNTGYFRCSEMSPKEFIKLVREILCIFIKRENFLPVNNYH